MQFGPTIAHSARPGDRLDLVLDGPPGAPRLAEPRGEDHAHPTAPRASARTAGSTAFAGRLTSARSSPRGRSSTRVTEARPRMASPLGLTGKTSPGKPGARRFWTSRWPSFAGFREAPRTATPRGAKSGVRSTVTGDAPARTARRQGTRPRSASGAVPYRGPRSRRRGRARRGAARVSAAPSRGSVRAWNFTPSSRRSRSGSRPSRRSPTLSRTDPSRSRTTARARDSSSSAWGERRTRPPARAPRDPGPPRR